MAVLLAGAFLADKSAALLVLVTVLALRLAGVGAAATDVRLPEVSRRYRPALREFGRLLICTIGVLALSALGVLVWWLSSRPHTSIYLSPPFDRVPESLRLSAPSWRTYVTVLALLWLTGALWRYRLRFLLGDRKGPLSGTAPSPDTGHPRLKEVYATLRHQQTGPELLYRDHAPLTGLGELVEQAEWAVGFELVSAKDESGKERVPEPVNAAILHRAIAEGVRTLQGGHEYPKDRLHGISVTDRVFRPGLQWGPVGGWLGGMSLPDPAEPGAVVLDSRWASALGLCSHERLRHFLMIRIGSWNEEVVTTILVRATTQGHILYLEYQPYVLLPISEAYHAIDAFAPVSLFSDGVETLLEASWCLGRDMIAAFTETGRVVRSVARTVRNRARYRRLVRGEYPVDHAPGMSVRERGAADRYQNPFQYYDVDRFLATVQIRVITAVLDELKKCGYDVTALELQAQNVTNNINNGGVQGINYGSGPQAVGGRDVATSTRGPGAGPGRPRSPRTP